MAKSGSKKAAGGKKSKAAKTSEPQDEYAERSEAATTSEAEPAAEATPAEGKTEPAANSMRGPTLYEISEKYLAWLDEEGAGEGTISSYGMELKLAQRELGDNTPVADLTVERVAEYFASNAVMKTRTGKRKAEPTWKKTQRVLRLALVWAKEEGLIDVAPIPETKPVKLQKV